MRDRFDRLRDSLDAAVARRERSEQDGDGSSDATDDPAFPFDATTARSVYVRPETLQRAEDVEALVDARLRTEYGIRNLTTREFYDALLWVGAEEPDAVVRRVLAARRDGDG